MILGKEIINPVNFNKYQVLICDIDRTNNKAKIYIPKNLTEIETIYENQMFLLDNYIRYADGYYYN